ncbi:branched-chain amino acid ABC transporter permease [Armatimonas rosea]|uniref:Branched-chain amino acid transport system permease protein n=1 Tax=Armatimonas rosea TaxID=685828 RepID=A0A7W9SRU0_ARMRO|nr:branched-chain amino acid ABC transporter permease [Armatimonas rosea]MBB6051671.1 branched-chain amino acid transport system permease protein [Armatimonas rosea]
MQKTLLKRLGWAAVALVGLMAGSLLFPLFLQDVVYRVVMLCGIAIIMAVSLNLINGFTGQFSIGHAGFQAVGAYVAASLTVYGHDKLFSFVPKDGNFSTMVVGGLKLPIYSLLSGGPAMLASMLIGGLVAAGIGYLVGLPSLRLRGDYLAIVTLGFGEIIRVIVENLDVVGGPRGFSGDLKTGIQVPALTNFFWVYGTVLVVILVSRNLRFSVHGLSYLSVREDEIAAQAMGVNTTTVKVKAFVLGAFFAGVAGALFAHYERTILITSFNFVRSFDFVTMVVLGGLGSITGAALAAVVLTALPEVLRYTLGTEANKYRLVVYALALVIMMLVRPQGIFGRGELSFRRFIKKKEEVQTG